MPGVTRGPAAILRWKERPSHPEGGRPKVMIHRGGRAGKRKTLFMQMRGQVSFSMFLDSSRAGSGGRGRKGKVRKNGKWKDRRTECGGQAKGGAGDQSPFWTRQVSSAGARQFPVKCPKWITKVISSPLPSTKINR